MFERIIYLGMPIDDSVSELLVAQLLWLGRPISSLQTNKVEPIYMYVNSTGMAKNPDKPGNEHQAFAVYTMMLAVQKFCPIYTLCVGNAFGEAALLLSAGTPGKRAALRSSTIMIRQPLQRYSGLQASDIDIYRREIRYTTNLMADYLAWHTKKDIETIKRDFARPRYFTPYEAVDYGLIDTVLEPHDNDRILYKDWDKIGSKIGQLQVDDDSDTVPSNILY